ncbi:upf0481 protein [Quercus suber]|uniref:Upf0481 protein n=1 Tax=Quercus suber TaxID=58331 RepID=A0AAW0IHY1_QUESU
MDVEKEAREYYDGPIGYETNAFVKILVVDGCFIIELLRKFTYNDRSLPNDPIFTMSCMQQFLRHDLILLENQVPWMVLELLFNMTMDPEQPLPLLELAKIYFYNIFSNSLPEDILSSPPHINFTDIEDIKHIPDLLRRWMISLIEEVEDSPQTDNWDSSWQPILSATSLVEAGIKFERGTSKSILDIKFDEGKGVLKIPPLLIQETTESTLRNLISFEQCYPKCEHRFTSYAILIDSLINSAKDAEILGKKKILDNWLNPEDAAQFFNKLYHNAYVYEYYYGSLSSKLSRYCEQSWPKWRAALVRNYFNTPWAILSTIAAAILLILSFLQTCEVNLNGGRARQKVDLQTLITTSIDHYNVVSIVVENYVSDCRS